MEEDPSKNPLEGAKLPENFSVDDIVDAKTAPDVQASSGEISKDDLLYIKGLLREVNAGSYVGTINDHALEIIHEIRGESQGQDLPEEAAAAVEYLHTIVESSVVDNAPDVIMGFGDVLRNREGDLFQDALDYPAGDEIDQEKYIRILENLTSIVELIATWELLQRQRTEISVTLFDRLSSSIADMKCYELAAIIDRSFIAKD